MIEQLLPPAVMVAEAYNDDELAPLFAEEEAAMARAVLKRRREFAAVRACARTALGKLGVDPVPLVPGERGAPRWPVGVVGSMTHCDGYRACAVARADDILTLGIDAEPAAALPEGVLDLVSHPAEREMLDQLGAAHPGVSWDRTLFCIKESVYKAWFPLTGRWLGFEEAMVHIGADGTFVADLLVPGPVVDSTILDSFEGRWLSRDGLILSVIATGTAAA